MSVPARIVMLGVDAASPTLLREWVHDGTLPNLGSMLARGFSAPTHSVPGFYVGSTWPSLYTGSSPARHGFHYQAQLRPGTYELYRPQDERLVQSPAFWHYLSEAGKRVAILDVPLTQLEPRINGLQIVEWGGHDAVYGFCTNPPDLAQRIHAAYGDHPAGPICDGVRTRPTDYRQFADRLVDGVRAKSRMTRELFAQEPWDFFAQVFTETHCAGHQCWHLHDSRHPAYDAGFAAAAGDPIRSVYVAVDRALGEITRETGDALVFVVVAHGMASFHGAQFLLRDILARLGVCRVPQTAKPAVPSGSALRSGARAIWHRLPGSVRTRLAPVRALLGGNGHVAPAAPTLGVDAANSLCFPVGNGQAVGGIRLNLAGREPHGLLQPGREADSFVAELRASLTDIIDERTGGPLVRRVVRTRDLCDGPCANALPDLLVEWNDTPTGSSRVGNGRGGRVSARSARIGHVEGENSYTRTGEHRPGGMIVAVGPGVPGVALTDPVSVLDVAPTVCALLGVPLDVREGTPIRALLR